MSRAVLQHHKHRRKVDKVEKLWLLHVVGAKSPCPLTRCLSDGTFEGCAMSMGKMHNERKGEGRRERAFINHSYSGGRY